MPDIFLKHKLRAVRLDPVTQERLVKRDKSIAKAKKEKENGNSGEPSTR